MPTSNDELNQEMLRTRDRLHSIETRLATVELQQQHGTRVLESVSTQLAEMIESDKIAVEVAARVNARRNVALTRLQRGALALAALAPLASLILRLAGVEGAL